MARPLVCEKRIFVPPEVAEPWRLFASNKYWMDVSAKGSRSGIRQWYQWSRHANLIGQQTCMAITYLIGIGERRLSK